MYTSSREAVRWNRVCAVSDVMDAVPGGDKLTAAIWRQAARLHAESNGAHTFLSALETAVSMLTPLAAEGR